MKTVNLQEYQEILGKMPRKGLENVKAFLNYNTKTICTDPHSLLIPLDDHIVHRGDGAFESLRCSNGSVFQLDKHLERMETSLSALKLCLPFPLHELKNLILETAKVGSINEGNIKLLVGRGMGGFGVDPKECFEPSIYIIASETAPIPESFWENGLTAARSSIPVKQKYLANIKSTNYLPNVLMAQEAHEKNVNMVFSFDNNNYLAETAIANVGMYKNNTFYFPTFDNILAGTTALLALDCAKAISQVQLTNITEEMLFNADEIFILGTTVACVGVTHYENKAIGSGKVGTFAIELRKLLMKALYNSATPYLDKE